MDLYGQKCAWILGGGRTGEIYERDILCEKTVFSVKERRKYNLKG